MYGLEKEPKKVFQFDLEEEINTNPKKAKDLLNQVENRIVEIKSSINSVKSKAEQDKLGILLQGYNSLKKVLNRVLTKGGKK